MEQSQCVLFTGEFSVSQHSFNYPEEIRDSLLRMEGLAELDQAVGSWTRLQRVEQGCGKLGKGVEMHQPYSICLCADSLPVSEEEQESHHPSPTKTTSTKLFRHKFPPKLSDTEPTVDLMRPAFPAQYDAT